VVRKSFSEAQYKFLQTLIGMSGGTRLIDREDWMGTPAWERERCVEAMGPMRTHWPFGVEDLARLEDMLTCCLRHYEDGQLDAGDYLVRDIEELLYLVRQKR